MVAHWVNSLARKVSKPGLSSSSSSTHGNIPRGPPVVVGRPVRKDANEMSISMESSRSSVGTTGAGASGMNASLSTILSADDLNTSRDRMQLSNNPFTSSGSFNFNSASFSAASNSSSGVGASNPTARAILSTANSTAASRYRMTYGIGEAAPQEQDEYEEDEFEEEVETYDHNSYDYKRQEEKKDSKHYTTSKPYK